jgi:hypothetical protein
MVRVGWVSDSAGLWGRSGYGIAWRGGARLIMGFEEEDSMGSDLRGVGAGKGRSSRGCWFVGVLR